MHPRLTCRHGHAMAPENILTDKFGHRRCRTCEQLKKARQYRQRRDRRAT